MAVNNNCVELLNVMGDDLMVVNAARVSFAKESHEFSLADEKLINYLAKHNHVSPFFHPQIQFRIRMPIFVAREWFRHQIGFSRNEVSRRYVNSFPECWVPSIEDMREKDPKVKQGSKDSPVENAEACVDMTRISINMSISTYNTSDTCIRICLLPGAFVCLRSYSSPYYNCFCIECGVGYLSYTRSGGILLAMLQ